MMKKTLITALLIGAFLPITAQTAKKKVYKKKPIKKTVVKKVAPKPKAETTAVVSVQEEVAPKPIKVVEIVPSEEEIAENQLAERLEKIGQMISKKGGYIKNRNSVYYKGIIAMFKGVYTNENKIYILLDVKNTSNLDYDIESVFFNTSPVGKKKENLELEERNFLPIWDNKISVIKKKSSQKLVYAFDKFTLNDEKVMNVTLRENDGEREINIVVTPNQISEAEYIRL